MNLPLKRWDTKEEILAHYELVLELDMGINQTPQEKMSNDAPKRVLIVKIDHISKYMVYASYRDDEWYPNDGERYAIGVLLNMLSTKKCEVKTNENTIEFLDEIERLQNAELLGDVVLKKISDALEMPVNLLAREIPLTSLECVSKKQNPTHSYTEGMEVENG